VASVGIQNHIATKNYAMLSLSMLDALRAGGAPQPALAGDTHTP
jgi:hypothetical protein